MLFLQFLEVLKIATLNVDDKKKDVSYIKREYSGLHNPSWPLLCSANSQHLPILTVEIVQNGQLTFPFPSMLSVFPLPTTSLLSSTPCMRFLHIK